MGRCKRLEAESQRLTCHNRDLWTRKQDRSALLDSSQAWGAKTLFQEDNPGEKSGQNREAE